MSQSYRPNYPYLPGEWPPKDPPKSNLAKAKEGMRLRAGPGEMDEYGVLINQAQKLGFSEEIIMMMNKEHIQKFQDMQERRTHPLKEVKTFEVSPKQFMNLDYKVDFGPDGSRLEAEKERRLEEMRDAYDGSAWLAAKVDFSVEYRRSQEDAMKKRESDINRYVNGGVLGLKNSWGAPPGSRADFIVVDEMNPKMKIKINPKDLTI